MDFDFPIPEWNNQSEINAGDTAQFTMRTSITEFSAEIDEVHFDDWAKNELISARIFTIAMPTENSLLCFHPKKKVNKYFYKCFHEICIKMMMLQMKEIHKLQTFGSVLIAKWFGFSCLSRIHNIVVVAFLLGVERFEWRMNVFAIILCGVFWWHICV